MQRLDSCSGCYKGDERVAIFIDPGKAKEFKAQWEKQWKENESTTKSPCYMDARPQLIMKEAQTNDDYPQL